MKYKMCRFCKTNRVNKVRDFCSDECFAKYKEAIKSGHLEKITNGQRSVRRTASHMHNIYKKLNTQEGCALCGWKAVPEAAGLINGHLTAHNGCHVHHIVHYAEGGTDDLNNLIVLCPNCHAQAHLSVYSSALLFESTRQYQNKYQEKTYDDKTLDSIARRAGLSKQGLLRTYGHLLREVTP